VREELIKLGGEEWRDKGRKGGGGISYSKEYREYMEYIKTREYRQFSKYMEYREYKKYRKWGIQVIKWKTDKT